MEIHDAKKLLKVIYKHSKDITISEAFEVLTTLDKAKIAKGEDLYSLDQKSKSRNEKYNYIQFKQSEKLNDRKTIYISEKGESFLRDLKDI